MPRRLLAAGLLALLAGCAGGARPSAPPAGEVTRLAERLAPLRLADFEGTPEWFTLGFLKETVEAARQVRVCRYELWPVNQLSGWQALFAQLADTQPVGSDAARADALARWSRLPRYLDNEIANLREGVRLGYTTPKANVRLVVEQLDAPSTDPARRPTGWAASGSSASSPRPSPSAGRSSGRRTCRPSSSACAATPPTASPAARSSSPTPEPRSSARARG